MQNSHKHHYAIRRLWDETEKIDSMSVAIQVVLISTLLVFFKPGTRWWDEIFACYHKRHLPLFKPRSLESSCLCDPHNYQQKAFLECLLPLHILNSCSILGSPFHKGFGKPDSSQERFDRMVQDLETIFSEEQAKEMRSSSLEKRILTSNRELAAAHNVDLAADSAHFGFVERRT